jgi:hypothetical protein
MRRLVLSFWISLDGYSCDDGTELCRVMQELPGDKESDDYLDHPLTLRRRTAARSSWSAAAVHQPDFAFCDGVVGEAEIDGRVLAREKGPSASQQDGHNTHGEHIDGVGGNE